MLSRRLVYNYDNPVDILIEYSRRRNNDTFIVDEAGRSMTYGELYENSMKLADSLSRLGVGYGDRVGIVMSNSIEEVVSLFASWMIGASTVMIDPLTISEDLDFQLSDSSPKVVIADGAVIEREINVLSRYRVIGVNFSKGGIPDLNDVIRGSSTSGFKPASTRRDDVGLIYYYAGIAGRTMQVWHTYFSLYSGPYAFGEAIGLGNNDTVLVVAQLTHILGLTELLSAFVRGSRVVIARHFDAKDTPELMSRYGVTIFAGVPLMFDQL
ncbi:MAG: AMP-binding protein, partial [Vulcanisaeta sp.]